MSVILASQQILRRRRSSSPGNSAAVTVVPTGSLRNNFSGFVGCRFVANANLYVKSLGRWKVAGNSATHTVKISDVSGVDVAGASASVDLSTGSADSFVYTRLTAPVLLTSGSTYFLGSQEVSSGDQWYDQQNVSFSADITINSAAFNNGSWTATGGAICYVPPGFLYDLTP